MDNLTKLALIDEKELGHKFAEIGDNMDKSICWDIINLYGAESGSPKDTAKKGILGEFLFFCSFLTKKIITEAFPFSPYLKMVAKLLLLFPVFVHDAAFCNPQDESIFIGKRS